MTGALDATCNEAFHFTCPTAHSYTAGGWWLVACGWWQMKHSLQPLGQIDKSANGQRFSLEPTKCQCAAKGNQTILRPGGSKKNRARANHTTNCHGSMKICNWHEFWQRIAFTLSGLNKNILSADCTCAAMFELSQL